MQILQSSPTIVVDVSGDLVKIFRNSDECKEEVDRLNKAMSPLVVRSCVDDYEMSVVKVVASFKNILVMERAKGVTLVDSQDLDFHIDLIGKYLAKFHRNVYEIEGVSSPRIFGDFSVDHVFIDPDIKLISTIDPGANFLVIGNQLEDIARFLFSVTERFRYRPLLCSRIMKSFLGGYRASKSFEFSDLSAVLNFRKKRSVEKYRLQKSPMRAFFGVILLNYNRLIIKWILKC